MSDELFNDLLPIWSERRERKKIKVEYLKCEQKIF